MDAEERADEEAFRVKPLIQVLEAGRALQRHLVELTEKLRDEVYYPNILFANALTDILEEDVVRLLDGALAFDEFESMFDAVEDAYPEPSQIRA
jgi:hypothetical protein